MARNNDRDRGTKRVVKDDKRRVMKKKASPIAADVTWVDYKDINLLKKFMSERGKIRARRVTGLSTQHQRAVAVAIKTARELALLPYVNRNITERGPRPPRAPRNTETVERDYESPDGEVEVDAEEEEV